MRNLSLFCVVGTIGFLVDSSILMISISLLGLGLYFGRLLSFTIAVLVTWELNRRYTFRQASPKNYLSYLCKLRKYITSSLIGISINLGLYYFLVIKFEAFNDFPWLAVAIGSIAALIVNYSLSRWWVFREK